MRYQAEKIEKQGKKADKFFGGNEVNVGVGSRGWAKHFNPGSTFRRLWQMVISFGVLYSLIFVSKEIANCRSFLTDACPRLNARNAFILKSILLSLRHLLRQRRRNLAVFAELSFRCALPPGHITEVPLLCF